MAAGLQIRSRFQRKNAARVFSRMNYRSQRRLFAAGREPVILEVGLRIVCAKLADIAQREAPLAHQFGRLNLMPSCIEKFEAVKIPRIAIAYACGAEHAPRGQFRTDIELSSLEQDRSHVVPLP